MVVPYDITLHLDIFNDKSELSTRGNNSMKLCSIFTKLSLGSSFFLVGACVFNFFQTSLGNCVATMDCFWFVILNLLSRCPARADCHTVSDLF